MIGTVRNRYEFPGHFTLTFVQVMIIVFFSANFCSRNTFSWIFRCIPKCHPNIHICIFIESKASQLLLTLSVSTSGCASKKFFPPSSDTMPLAPIKEQKKLDNNSELCITYLLNFVYNLKKKSIIIIFHRKLFVFSSVI